MSKKPTTAQIATLDRIRRGRDPHPTARGAYCPSLSVLSFHSAVEGDTVLAHRTVESTTTPRTEMFRVSADGTARGV